MKFIPTMLTGAYVIELERHEDERGFFARTWCRDEFAQLGLSAEIAQCSVSRSARVGTLRGMHYQRTPHEEVKLVHCTRGAIFDVIIDLRSGSPTHTHWLGVELNEERGTALYVPRGFAHGFQTLTDDAEVAYTMSTSYVPDSATGVRWDDPAFSIEWPVTGERTMSERDRTWPDYVPET